MGDGGNYELRLISKIVKSQDLNSVVKSGITPNTLSNPIAQAMFQDIVNYFHNREHYGCVPPSSWMKKRYPGSYHEMRVQETLGELCAAVREDAMEREIYDAAQETIEICGSNPAEALEYMRAAVLRIGRMAPKSSDRIIADDAEEIIERAERRRNADEIMGIPLPWDELNKLTQGIQDEDFMVIFGRPKSMKSFLAGKVCTHAYLRGNCRVLVYSCEMSTALFEDRLACTLHDLNYEGLKQGTTSRIDWMMYQDALRSLKNDEIRDAVNGKHRSLQICSAFDDSNGGGVSHLLSKVEEFGPDLIVVDSFYKMKDDRTGKRSTKWDVQANITQDLKGITQLLHKPVVAVTQRHRAKSETDDDEDLGDIAYADSVGQEADIVYRVKKDGMLPDGRTVQLRINIAGAREIRVGGFLLHVVPSTSWKFVQWLDENNKLVDDPNTLARRAKDPTKNKALRARGGKPKEREQGLGPGYGASLGVERR